MPISEETSKKKKSASKKHSSSMWDINREEINDRLTAIYQGNNGSMPDMKKITIKKSNIFLKGLVVILILGTIVSAIAWVNFFLAPTSDNTSEKYVVLELLGPSSAQFGKIETYTIRFKNISTGLLKNSTLNIRYPQGFIFASSSVSTKNSGHNEIDLGTIAAGTEKTISISGTLYGGTQVEKMWRASLNFQPENLNSPLIKTASFINSIKESPFSLSITAPDKITPGQEFDYIFTITPKEQTSLTRLELLPVVSDSFQITSSSPSLSTKDRWILTSTTSSLKNMVYRLKGLFKNTTDDNSVKAQLFVLPTLNTSDRFQIAEVYSNAQLPSDTNTTDLNPLVLSVNSKSDKLESFPGDTLVFNVILKNTTKEPMKDILVKLGIDAPSYNKQSALNWKLIKDVHDGDIHGEQLSTSIRHGQILWAAKKIPALTELKPGDEITIEVTLPVKDSKTFNFQEVTEHTISVLAQTNFTSSEGAKTLSTSPVTISLNSDLGFEIKKSASKNESGKKEFPLSWVVTNTFHPLKNVVISASLSSGLEPTDDFQTPAGTAKFDKEKKQIIWTIPEIPESIDILAWEFSLLQDAPGVASLSNITIEADDTISGNKISLKKETVNL